MKGTDIHLTIDVMVLSNFTNFRLKPRPLSLIWIQIRIISRLSQKQIQILTPLQNFNLLFLSWSTALSSLTVLISVKIIEMANQIKDGRLYWPNMNSCAELQVLMVKDIWQLFTIEMNNIFSDVKLNCFELKNRLNHCNP